MVTPPAITYRVQNKDGNEDPYKYFSKRTNQSIKSRDPQTADVTVHQVSEGLPIPEGIERENAPDRLHEGVDWISSVGGSLGFANGKQVYGSRITGSPENERWALGVFHVINRKDFSRSIFGAGEVAMKMEGDCTANAILLAAIARSQGVPSRLACGFVYADVEGKPSLSTTHGPKFGLTTIGFHWIHFSHKYRCLQLA